MTDKKNKVGRPPITLDNLPAGWQIKWLTLAIEGASEVEIRVEVLGGICHESMMILDKNYPEFSETRKMAKALCEAWWIKHGRLNLNNKHFQYVGWYMQMKNRFGWRDKIETKNETEIKHSADGSIETLLSKLSSVKSDDST